MKEFTSEEIQAQFEKLPKELQDAISSPDIHDKIQKIGGKHNLHIDQIGELVDQIGLVMLGLKKASNFVADTSARLSISQKNAKEVADDINREIFSTIKTHMREAEEQSTINDREIESKTISSIEHAGGFSVVKEDSGEDMGKAVTSADKADILESIENPQPGKETVSQKTGPGYDDRPESFTEPLVDQLLENTTARPEEKLAQASALPTTSEPSGEAPDNLPVIEEASESIKPAVPTVATESEAPIERTPPPSPSKNLLEKTSADSYREPIN